MQVAILAGGRGQRMRSVSPTPKVLLPIAGKPVLQHQVEWLKKAGFSKIFFCLGHQAEEIRGYFGDGSKFGVKIGYSQEHEPLGTSGAIKMAAKNVNDTIIVVNGDVLHDADPGKILKFHEQLKENKPELTATVFLVRMIIHNQ